jgi:hypothetical protein
VVPRGPGRLLTLPEIAAEEAVQLTYTVLVGEAPAGVTEIVCQGLVCATNTPKVPSDDPDLPGPDDPTVTPLDPPMGIVEVPVLGVVGLVELRVVLACLGCWVILRRRVGVVQWDRSEIPLGPAGEVGPRGVAYGANGLALTGPGSAGTTLQVREKTYSGSNNGRTCATNPGATCSAGLCLCLSRTPHYIDLRKECSYVEFDRPLSHVSN